MLSTVIPKPVPPDMELIHHSLLITLFLISIISLLTRFGSLLSPSQLCFYILVAVFYSPVKPRKLLQKNTHTPALWCLCLCGSLLERVSPRKETKPHETTRAGDVSAERGQGWGQEDRRTGIPTWDKSPFCPTSPFHSSLLLIFQCEKLHRTGDADFPRVSALGDSYWVPKSKRQPLQTGRAAQQGQTATAEPWQWQSQAQEQVEDACKNNGDLAVSWLEQNGRAASLSCTLRIVLDSSAANHFSHPGIFASPISWDKVSNGTYGLSPLWPRTTCSAVINPF